jgi:CO/xanthine dehydrogenase Mo-binding subunit
VHGYAAWMWTALRSMALPRRRGALAMPGISDFHRDDPFRNPLFAKVLRSPFAHAEVAAIDASEARKLPGYRGMVTAADEPDIHGDRRLLNRKARYCPMKVHPSAEQLARRLSKDGGLVGLGHYVWNPSTQAWGAAFAEVEVDMETGIVRVLRYVSGHDVGRLIYRRGAEAQVHGGAIMGMGFGLTEALIVDPNTHIPINGSYIGLGPMTALDYPEITPIMVESPAASGPYGAKGLGENPVFNAAPAIANAIYNASGVRIEEIPFTWDRVFERLRAAGRLAA